MTRLDSAGQKVKVTAGSRDGEGEGIHVDASRNPIV